MFECSAFVSAKRGLQVSRELSRCIAGLKLKADSFQPPSLRRQAAEKLYELVEVNRLRDVLVAPRGERLRVEVRGVVRRDCDDGDAARALLLAYAARGGEPVELRQAQVHKDYVGLLTRRGFDGLIAGG